MSAPPPQPSAETARRAPGAERAKAFVDAVVAIAMTLLILPLMDSVTEAATHDATTWEWVLDHHQQLTSFVLSFVIIALFWIRRHQLDAAVARVTVPMLWLSVAWLLPIVFLPVATALTGRMPDDDPLAKIVYVGSMICACLLTAGMRLYLRRHPDLHDTSPSDLADGLRADLSMSVLFTVGLVVAITVPAIGYLALFVMFLTGPLAGLMRRIR